MTTHAESQPESWLHNEHGSSTMLMLFSLPILFTLVVLVVDVGQLIFERIRLQTTADACALAGAAVQSQGLNEIADLNNTAWDEYQQAKQDLQRSPYWVNATAARQAVSFYKQVQGHIHRLQDQVNREFAFRATSYAQDVCSSNLPDANLTVVGGSSVNRLMSVRRVEEFQVNYTYYVGSCSRCPAVPVRSPTASGASSGAPGHTPWHDNFAFYFLQRVGTVPGQDTLEVLWEKDTPPMTYAAYRLSQPAKGYILGNDLFNLQGWIKWGVIPSGYSSFINQRLRSVFFPELVAYAAAKPTAGDVHGRSPEYEPMLYPLNDLRPSPSIAGLGNMEH